MVFPSDPSPRIRQEGFLSHILVRIRCCNANQMVYVMGTRAGVRVRPRAAGTEGLLPPNLPEWVAVGLPRGGAGFVHSRFSSPGSVGLVSHPPGILGAAALGVQAQRLPKAASAQRSREFQLRAPGAGPGRGGALPLPVCDQKPPRERRGQRPDPESRLDDLPNFSLPSEPQRRRGLRKRGGPARPRQQVGDLADANPNNAAELPGHSHRYPQRTAETLGGLERPERLGGRGRSGGGPKRRAHAHARRRRGLEDRECVRETTPGRTGAQRACVAATGPAMAPSRRVRVLRCCSCRLFQAHQVGWALASPSSGRGEGGQDLAGPRGAGPPPGALPPGAGAVPCGCLGLPDARTRDVDWLRGLGFDTSS